MSTHCQITVKRPERRVDLTVTAEQQACGVQVVEGVGLVAFFPLGNIFGFGCAVFAEEGGDFGAVFFDGPI